MVDVEKLKQKILDLAIRGKLVPQDPNDEPASVLIEKIKAEKAKLIKEGKIKASKEESYIYKGSDNFYYEKKGNKITRINDIPFDIPVSWSWVRLSDICSKIVDGDHNPPKGSDVKTDFIMLSATNINDDKICDLNKVRYIIKDEYKTQNERTKIQNGDILLTIVGTMGRSCVYYGVPKNVCFQRSVSVLTTLIDNNYLKIVFDSKYIQDYMQFNAIGTAQKGFYLNQLSNLIIPVPPLNEQIRISKIISNVKDKISIITVNLKDIESITQEIRFKILESVFDENSSYKSYYEKPKLNTLCRLSNGDYSEGQELPYLEAKVIRGSKQPKVVKSGIKISKGTIIILVDGENSGEVMTAPFDGYMGSTFRILEINTSKITKDYLLLFLLFNKQRFKDNKKGSAIPHLNKKLFNELTIILPDKVKQKMIVEYASKVFANLDNIID